MQFTQEIKRLTFGLLVAFGMVALAAAYWGTIGTSTITRRDDNPRNVEIETHLHRGLIVDRDNQTLVQSVFADDQIGQRQYLAPTFYSALGYASYRYGVSGAEEAFNTLLRGDDRQPPLIDQWMNGLLHRPQIGSDIMLSFDSGVQETADRLMEGKRGAIVVLSVPTGQILTMLSLPTFDPNTLDANWSDLTQSPEKPFFNRALQGAYQPGGLLQLPLAAAAILTRHPSDAPIPNAAQRVRLNNIELGCAAAPPTEMLSLRQAFAYGCPYPFAQLAEVLGIDTVQAVLTAFHLQERLPLEGYIRIPQGLRPPTLNLNAENLLETTMGQGALQIAPLQMAVLAAAILNDGNAPVPYTLLAVRPPGITTWEDRINHNASPIPLITSEVASQMRAWMRDAVSYGAAAAAGRKAYDIGGQVARSFSGQGSQVWFIGFAALGGRNGVTVAVVLEDTDDSALAAQIGGEVLTAATHITTH